MRIVSFKRIFKEKNRQLERIQENFNFQMFEESILLFSSAFGYFEFKKKGIIKLKIR